MAATGQGRASARVNVSGRGETNVATGVPVLDHLLTMLAVYASFDLALEVEPGNPEVEITAAARSLGEALAEPLRAPSVRGHGSAEIPVDEALAHVTLEASGRPMLVSKVDLSEARIAGPRRRPRRPFPGRADADGRADAPRQADRGQRHAARPGSDLQSSRRRTRAGAHAAQKGERMKEVIRTECRAGAVPGRAVLPGDQGGRARLRRRPALAEARPRRDRRRDDSGADRAGAREPARASSRRPAAGWTGSSRPPSSSRTWTTFPA